MPKLRIELLKMPEWAKNVIVARVIEMPECSRGKGLLEQCDDSAGRWFLASEQKPYLCSRAIYVCGRFPGWDHNAMVISLPTTEEADRHRQAMRTLVRKHNERLAKEAGEACVENGNTEIIE